MSATQKKLIFSIAIAVVAVIFIVFIFNKSNLATNSEPEITSVEGSGPNIQTWNTKNGAKVLFVPTMQLPMLDLRVTFDAGAARDADKPGLASLTNNMLDQGAKLGKIKLSSDDIAERFDSIGARFGSSSLKDMALLSLRSLTDSKILNQSLETFMAVLQAPTFPQRDFDRNKKQMLISLKAQSQSPATIASKLFYKNLFENHVYSTSSSGTKKSIKALSIQDLKDFYAKYYVAKNAVIVMVGNLQLTQATKIAEKISSGLAVGEKAVALIDAARYATAKTISEQFPSSQTHIVMGNVGLKRGDKDYYALYVGNHILGGSGFSSRIVNEIREKRGLAYSSYSYFVPMRVNGPFIIGMQTKNEQTQEALKILNEVLVKFITEGPTAAELEHSKLNIAGGFPLRIDSNKEIVEYLAMIGFYDLPLDYLGTFVDNINTLTLEQIKDAFQRRVDPSKLLTIIVGDSKISKQILKPATPLLDNSKNAVKK
ncbi:FIG015287: Zinc protease [hydrothermal vent metagenome]|uniref:FIG015287: Zinc protease n=1 Tax=hydrothermal vent metagenome TaxID=652676 RepID=A0A3B1AIN5_9ZZZZ